MSSRKDGSSTDPRASDERIVGPFIVKQQIGKGSFAEVYIGWHRVRRPSLLFSAHAHDPRSQSLLPLLTACR